ncbi:MAG: hypothetical protein AAFO07_22270 [Bacteroidota bacterium]
MTRTEKRYFLSNNQVGKDPSKEPNFIKLYHELKDIDPKEYNEEAFRDKIKSKVKGNFSQHKKTLTEKILKSMRDYANKDTYSLKIREYIQDFKFLYDRELMQEAYSRLNEAKKLATELGDTLSLLEICKQERIFIWANSKNFAKELEILNQTENELVKQVEEEVNYRNESYKLFTFFKQGKYIGDSGKDQLKADFEEILLIKPATDSPIAKRRYLQFQFAYYKMLEDNQKMLIPVEALVKWWKEYPRYKEEDYFRYLSDYNLLITSYQIIPDYDRVKIALDKFSKEKPTKPKELGAHFKWLYNNLILYYLNTGQVTDFSKLEEEISFGLEEHIINAASVYTLNNNLAIYAFTCGYYEKCIHWCDKNIKRIKAHDPMERSYSVTLLLRFMALIEGDSENFDKECTRTKNLLIKINRFEQEHFEHIFFNDLIKWYKAVPSAQKEILKEIENYAENSYRDRTSRIYGDLDEFIRNWAISKLTSHPILKIYEDKKGVLQ